MRAGGGGSCLLIKPFIFFSKGFISGRFLENYFFLDVFFLAVFLAAFFFAGILTPPLQINFTSSTYIIAHCYTKRLNYLKK